MLDKARNNLINHAFQLAGITSPESEPTAAEIADAAHTLNVMLQSWNNDGFRLFKIKDGFMPFEVGKSEYKLSTEAYSEYGSSNVISFKQIGATKLTLNNISGVSEGASFAVINNTVSDINSIKSVDYTNAIVTLEKPLNMSVYNGDSVFFGDFSVAQTQIKTFNSAFDTIKYLNYITLPQVGDELYFSYNNTWTKRNVQSVNAASREITFTPAVSRGDITKTFILFGDNIFTAKNLTNAQVSMRKMISEGFLFDPVSVSLPAKDGFGKTLSVERSENSAKEIVFESIIPESVLENYGKIRIDATTIYPSTVELSWTDLAPLVPVNELDWGSVADTSIIHFDDWGYVVDPATTLIDWGTLTGDAELVGFGKQGNDIYAIAHGVSADNYFLFYKEYSQPWEVVDVQPYEIEDYNLYTAGNFVYLYDFERGVFSLNQGSLTQIYNNGVEAIIKFGDLYYLISPLDDITGLRTVASTSDFNSFSEAWTIDLPDIQNPAEFMGKLYIGYTDTYVTADMKTFSNIKVYAQNRCVVGDRLMNLNTAQVCSYTLDGVNFKLMPLMLSNETVWGYKDGCSFIAVYGGLVDGVVGTQIFTANDFNPVWTPQLVVQGRVFDIAFNNSNEVYFLSDIEVKSLKYIHDSIVQDAKVYGFGNKIGRPQEVMNVVKYSLTGKVELPMDAVSLKDYTKLPKISSDGEPISYCFFRDAKDGKMLIWGTPSKFGEYLKFSYVEPIALLEDADSTPDFPDEYYEAVEDGLAAELAYHYQLPVERIQALEAKAAEAKEMAELHDNEDTSYKIAPNQRGL